MFYGFILDGNKNKIGEFIIDKLLKDFYYEIKVRAERDLGVTEVVCRTNNSHIEFILYKHKDIMAFLLFDDIDLVKCSDIIKCIDIWGLKK